MKKEVNVVSVTKGVMLTGWSKPVTMIVTESGHAMTTEFPTSIRVGKQELIIGKKNTKGFYTFTCVEPEVNKPISWEHLAQQGKFRTLTDDEEDYLMYNTTGARD